MVNNYNVGNNPQNAYGNIQRAGVMQNGRAVYRVIDSQGKEAGKLSVPQEQVDTFEKAYKDIMTTAPKIEEYVATHSSEKDINRRRNISRAIVVLGGALGASVPLITIKKSVTKKIIGTIIGAVAGIAGGFALSLKATTPPGTMKFAKATRTLSNIDVQPVLDEQA